MQELGGLHEGMGHLEVLLVNRLVLNTRLLVPVVEHGSSVKTTWSPPFRVQAQKKEWRTGVKIITVSPPAQLLLRLELRAS